MNRRQTVSRLLTLLLLPFCIAADAQPAQVDPHQHLSEILDRPMYRAWKLREEARTHDLAIPTLGIGEQLKRAGEAIRDFLDWLFTPRNRSFRSRSSGVSMLPSILKALAWTIAIAAVVVIVFFIIRSTSRAKEQVSAAHVLNRQQVEAAMESGDALALDASQWLDEAQRLAAEENFRAVYRALYLSLLSGLHSARKIEHNQNRTNWTYVQLFRGPDEERAIFGQLTEVFDRVWYGRKVVPERASLEELRGKVAMLARVGRQG